MRRRNHPVIVRLNDKEFIQLKDNVAKTSLSQEAYLRTVIAGNIPKERPPVEYHNLLRELRGIGRDINQICARLNAYGGMDADAYSARWTEYTPKENKDLPELKSSELLNYYQCSKYAVNR